ncbi:MAG: hypothetical protein K0U19_00185 [Proteobacteria bacterium]|nr:hypothetical protein [Pseudomonadota bacterium]
MAKTKKSNSQKADHASGERIIKKYNNRRLYDSQNSRYITLDELKELIINGEEFRVCTASGEDVTRQTLISILLAGEVMGQPLFSEQTLRNMVMFMQGPMRGPMKVFFEQCLPLFARSNSELIEKFGSQIGSKELDSLAVLQGNMVRQLMEQYVFRGLENYLTTQKNMEKMMSIQNPLSFANMFTPPTDKSQE